MEPQFLRFQRWRHGKIKVGLKVLEPIHDHSVLLAWKMKQTWTEEFAGKDPSLKLSKTAPIYEQQATCVVSEPIVRQSSIFWEEKQIQQQKHQPKHLESSTHFAFSAFFFGCCSRLTNAMGEPMIPGIRLEVTLLSGRGVALTAAADRVTVGQLKRWAEKQLAVGIAQLIYEVWVLGRGWYINV